MEVLGFMVRRRGLGKETCDSVRCGEMSRFAPVDSDISVAGAEDRGVVELLGFVCGAAKKR